jgi:hypothetical protein
MHLGLLHLTNRLHARTISVCMLLALRIEASRCLIGHDDIRLANCGRCTYS